MRTASPWRAALAAAALIVAPRFARAQAAAPQQSPVRLTLAEAIRRATENGEEVRQARSSVDLAHSQVVQARADALPQVKFGLTYQRTFASPFQQSSTGPGLPPFAPDTNAALDARIKYLEDEYPNMLPRGIAGLFAGTPFGRVNTWTGNMTVSQLLFQGGKVGSGMRGARAYERASAAQLDETRGDIVYRTRQAYLNALYADRLVSIADGGKALSEEQLHRVELNQRVGGAADYDLLRAQVEVANQEPQVIAARNERDIAFLQLRQLVNIPPDVPIELDAGNLVASSDSLVEVDWNAISTAIEARSSVAVAEANLEVRRQAVSFYKGDMWPALRFNLYMGTQAYPNGFVPQQWRRDWNASFTLSFPLFEGFRTRAQIDGARAELQQAEAQLSQTREQVTLEVERARAELVRARALLDARRQTVAWATRAQHLASVRFANGIATPLEVSDARLAMQQAQVNEAQATRDYLLGIAAMEKALGRPVPLRLVERRADAGGPTDRRTDGQTTTRVSGQ
jgi:outer membrane protein TolC